ncbi:hypothetical protein [Streptomyces sp. NPDC001880]
MAFADRMRATGYAVESIFTALEQTGLKIAARTLRAWSAPAGPSNRAAARTVTDALVEAAVRRLAFTTTKAGERVLAPEGLYGRRNMLALIRRTLLPEFGFGAVDRAMRSLMSGLEAGWIRIRPPLARRVLAHRGRLGERGWLWLRRFDGRLLDGAVRPER